MFDEFWKAYPARNGKKIGKALAEKAFNKLSAEDQAVCLIAVTNYANCKMVKQGIGIRDPARFIYDRLNKHDYFREWIEPETITPVLSDVERDTLKRELKRLSDMLERQESNRANYSEIYEGGSFAYWTKKIASTKADIKKIEEKLK